MNQWFHVIIALIASLSGGMSSQVEDPGQSEAWIKAWRKGTPARCVEAPCEWLTKVGSVDTGCRLQLTTTGLSSRTAPKMSSLRGRRTATY